MLFKKMLGIFIGGAEHYEVTHRAFEHLFNCILSPPRKLYLCK